MSSTVKSSSDSKRSHLPHQTKVPDQYRTQIPQLQELFPSWSVDGLSSLTFHLHACSSPPPLDLISTLVEAGGDVTLAATRISEGQHLVFISIFFHSFSHIRTRGAMGFRYTQKGQKNLGSD
jgi:hypothetical protein